MAQGGFRSYLPFGLRAMLLAGGTITPVAPLASSPVTSRDLVSLLDIRSHAQRIDGDKKLGPSAAIIAQALRHIQDADNAISERLRRLSTSVNSAGLIRDAGGNIVFSGSTFTVRAGTEIFALANGGMLFGVPNAAPNDDQIPNNHCIAYIDEVAEELRFRVRYSDGTLKTGTIPLL